jgi:hypothetical protein
MVNDADKMRLDVRDQIIHAAQTLFEPGQVTELRAIFKNGRVSSGYFDDFSALADIAATIDANGAPLGIYWTLNPVNPKCLHRAKNKLIDERGTKGNLTADKDILERRWLLLDFDGADRPAGISSDNTELDAALRKALQVMKFLSGKGWERPITAMSGNGYHLLYRVQFPIDKTNDDLVKKLLNSLAAIFDDSTIKLDTSVFNASRICKVYGTMARKGDDTQERPHRRAHLIDTAGWDV